MQPKGLEGIQNFEPASRICLQATNISYSASSDFAYDFFKVTNPISLDQLVQIWQRILVEHHYGTISRAAMTISIGTSSMDNEEPNDFSDNN